ncbi:MAG TPA: amino acid ABC transporter substrate-binding protein, partial [Bacteroidetes bacterium]|nr:amino acid ABC transporter substrate-binding protein [Bacteroidota bacterium]
MKNYRATNLYFIFLFLSSLFITSCGWLKPARESEKEKVYTDEDLGDLQGTRVFDPETGEWRTVRQVNQKVDTIRWTDLPEKDYPPIVTDREWAATGEPGEGPATTTGPGGVYDVSLILPFLANQSSLGEIDPNSYWAIHFYAGAQLAYDNLAREGGTFKITVSDSEGSAAKINRLLAKPAARNADLIIGPYKRDNVRVIEPFARKNTIPLAVPYTAQLGLAKGNPNYIQLNPSLKSHCEAITRHARAVYDTENIVLVARDNPLEKARFAYFQQANAEIEGTNIGARFREYTVGMDKNEQFVIDITPFISQGETSVFIIPSWSS